ncbi:uncharacterized protein V6R79_011144 [Siganus canaliculatus]
MASASSALQRSARQSVVGCSGLNCSARTAETLALSAPPAWSGNDSAVDAHPPLELQLPASAAATVSPRPVSAPRPRAPQTSAPRVTSTAALFHSAVRDLTGAEPV